MSVEDLIISFIVMMPAICIVLLCLQRGYQHAMTTTSCGFDRVDDKERFSPQAFPPGTGTKGSERRAQLQSSLSLTDEELRAADLMEDFDDTESLSSSAALFKKGPISSMD